MRLVSYIIHVIVLRQRMELLEKCHSKECGDIGLN